MSICPIVLFWGSMSELFSNFQLTEIGFQIIWTLGSLAMSIFAFKIWKQSRDTISWNAVAGKIIGSSIVENSEGMSVPRIEYEYTVNGLAYRSTQINIGFIPGDLGISKKVLERFPIGAEVTVFFSPIKHDESVLVQGHTAFNVVLYVVSLFFLSMGLFDLVRTFK